MDRRLFLGSSVAADIVSVLGTSRVLSAVRDIVDMEGDVLAVTGDRVKGPIERAAVADLADSLRGNLLLPGNSCYDTARRALNANLKPARRRAFCIM